MDFLHLIGTLTYHDQKIAGVRLPGPGREARGKSSASSAKTPGAAGR